MRKRSILLAGAAAVVVAFPTSAYAAPGDTWRPVTFLPIERIRDFAASGPAEVWHVGSDYAIGKGAVPAIFRWTGGLTLERHTPPGFSHAGILTDVTVRSADDVWIAGYTPTDQYALEGYTYLARYDGRWWNPVEPPSPLRKVDNHELASDSGGVWLVEDARVSRWDGTSWTSTTFARPISQIEALAPDDAWIKTGSDYWHWDGSSWQQVPSHGDYSRIQFADGVAWAATRNGLKTWDGSAWQTTPYPAPFDGALAQAGGLADSDGQWVVLYTADGEKGLLRWDGSEWTRYPLMPDGTGQVVVDDAGRIWGVNQISRMAPVPGLGGPQTKGQIVRLKNGAWERVGIGVGEANYRIIHLPGSDRLYSAGENQWNGADWVVTNR